MLLGIVQDAKADTDKKTEHSYTVYKLVSV